MENTPVLPFDSRTGTIWCDGELVKWKQAKIHVLNHGLHYASCVYEGERAYLGNVFKLDEHTQRLCRSAQILDLALPYSESELSEATRLVMRANHVEDGYVRPVIWRGSQMMSTSARANAVHVAVACWEWPSYFDIDAKMDGIRMTVADWRRPPSNCSPHEAKASGHYTISTISKHAAENKGFHDALMLDWRGHIAEATSGGYRAHKALSRRNAYGPVPAVGDIRGT